jgi:hypothetical protein
MTPYDTLTGVASNSFIDVGWRGGPTSYRYNGGSFSVFAEISPVRPSVHDTVLPKDRLTYLGRKGPQFHNDAPSDYTNEIRDHLSKLLYFVSLVSREPKKILMDYFRHCRIKRIKRYSGITSGTMVCLLFTITMLPRIPVHTNFLVVVVVGGTKSV